MHRLDKETDGLMIIAKTERGLAHFKHLFSQKSESETIEEKEAVPLKKMYKATSKVTPEGKAFLDSMSDFPFFIQENVLAKVPYTSPKLGITKILAIQPGVNKDPLLNTQDLILLTIEILT
jgi:23S rRNA-/tRNA-specific pseudouridylate synthase